MSPILKGVVASQITGHLVTSSYESIATVTLSSAQAAIEFTSIPSTYKHLQIRGIAKNVTTGTADYDVLRMRVNNDTATNYSWHYVSGQGSVINTNGTGTDTYYYSTGICRNGTGQTSVFSGGIIDILDYASTSKYKTFRALSGTEYNGTYDFVLATSGSWQSTSAITSIKFVVDNAANIAQFSSFALYGIKG